jgi:hypothetical protein
MEGEKDVGSNREEIVTFELPIKDPRGVVQMKIIPPSALPNFHALENKDPDTFLF